MACSTQLHASVPMRGSTSSTPRLIVIFKVRSPVAAVSAVFGSRCNHTSACSVRSAHVLPTYRRHATRSTAHTRAGAATKTDE